MTNNKTPSQHGRQQREQKPEQQQQSSQQVRPPEPGQADQMGQTTK